MKGKSLVLGLLISASIFAKSPKNHEKLFIKIKEGAKLPSSKLIERLEPIIGQIFVAHTSDAKTLALQLQGHESIEYTEPNRKSKRTQLPKLEPMSYLDFEVNNLMSYVFNDPDATKVWSFADSVNHGSSVGKAYGNPISSAKKTIIVAVADTGVDYRHEDLKDNMWINRDEIPGNKIDDDGNGYVDDVYGYDFLDNDSDPMASSWHGTHVAGTIAARQNNGIGLAGIASNVKIMALRVVPDRNDETDYDVGRAFVYAAKNGARIINCSFGKNRNERGQHVSDIMKAIGQKYGTLIIAAAGNDSFRDIDKRPTYPASFKNPNLMVVASTMIRGKLSRFTNVGKKNVDIAAPGSSIYSTVNGDRYGRASGTSMAAPTTTGVAAEVLSHFPSLSAIQLKRILMDSVTKVPEYEKYMVSGGRVNLYRALRQTKKYIRDYKKYLP